MDNATQGAAHVIFTWGTYLMSNWTEIGAGILMLMQFTLLALKLRDGYKKRYKEDKDGK